MKHRRQGLISDVCPFQGWRIGPIVSIFPLKDLKMQLIGMLDSPYVRRVAVSMHWLGLPFEHRPVSVFRQYAEFSAINPVVKAPTLVCDDGTVLMESGLILDHLESLASTSLWPTPGPARLQALRATGLALAACEKTVQIVYELQLRPPEKQHAPWLDRVRGQAWAAFDALEAELNRTPWPRQAEALTQGGVSAAVAWAFVQRTLPGQFSAARCPQLADFSAWAETLDVFTRAPME